jgi:hypothetical protein
LLPFTDALISTDSSNQSGPEAPLVIMGGLAREARLLAGLLLLLLLLLLLPRAAGGILLISWARRILPLPRILPPLMALSAFMVMVMVDVDDAVLSSPPSASSDGYTVKITVVVGYSNP